jgi:hypothetical protein
VCERRHLPLKARPPTASPGHLSPQNREGQKRAEEVIAMQLVFVLVIALLSLMAAGPVAAEMFGPDYQPCGDRPNTPAIVECVQAKRRCGISG